MLRRIPLPYTFGDSLNDFQRVYYVKDVDQRNALMEKDKNLFGEKFILLPNPTDGHWVRAILVNQNRRRLKKIVQLEKGS